MAIQRTCQGFWGSCPRSLSGDNLPQVIETFISNDGLCPYGGHRGPSGDVSGVRKGQERAENRADVLA